MLWWWVVTAVAAPFQMLQPAHTMPTGETEMGGAVAYVAPPAAFDAGNPLVAGWARYGALDRLEVSGGAYLPFSPLDFALHVGVRGQVLGPVDDDGFHLSVGLQVATVVNSFPNPQVVAPVALGVRTRTVDGFLVPSVGLIGTDSGTVASWSVEGGAAFKAASFPIYAAASYTDVAGFGVLGVHLGVGYNMAM